MNPVLLLLSYINISCIATAQQGLGNRGSSPPYDGVGNNLKQPTWGSAGTPFIRQPVSIYDYTSTEVEMAGPNRPHPREISLALMSSPYLKALNEKRTTNILTAMGQFAAVDITNRRGMPDNSSASPGLPTAPLEIPPGDPFMVTPSSNDSTCASRTTMKFRRSVYQRDAAGIRQQTNFVTHFLDASAVYGSSEGVATRLRAGVGGLLKDDGAGGLPFNTQIQLTNMTDDAHVAVPGTMRAAGFAVANQHPGLLAMATIWLREHNRRARDFVDNTPGATDEAAYQYARKWVMAHLQHIVFEEYTPVLLGNLLPTYQGYNESVNPSVDNFFCTVAMRYGHTVVTDVVERLDENWQQHPQGHLLLSQSYYNPEKVLSGGIEPIIRGLVRSSQGAVEPHFSSAVQHQLFGPANVNGSDLFAVNIQRGRDHGVPDYNTCRRLFGLKPFQRFEEISQDPKVAATLYRLYSGNISNIDAYVGALAESKHGRGHVGELVYSSIYDQFRRLRDGDWWYFENQDNGLFTTDQVSEIKTTGLRDILLRNTGIQDLPDNIWRITEDAAPAASASSTSSSNNSSNAAGDALYATARRDVRVLSVLGDQIKLEISEAADPGWLRVKLVGKFDSGFVGFGVAKQGQVPGQKMVGADIVIASFINGQPTVEDYHGVGHQPPMLDTTAGGKSQVKLIEYQRADKQTVLVFERPYAASDSGDSDQPILRAGPNSFLVAHGTDDSLVYHGVDNRVAIELQVPLFGGSVQIEDFTAIDPVALRHRTQHGTLMAVTFVVIFPLSALMARQLRSSWITHCGVRAALFYLHTGMQVCGVVMVTSGFAIANKTFGIPLNSVMLHHGTFGVVVMVVVYVQLLIGVARPPAAYQAARTVWQVLHGLVGRAGLMLGAVNVFVGMYLLNSLYKVDIVLWGGLCAAGLGSIAMAQYALDVADRSFAARKVPRLTRLRLSAQEAATNSVQKDPEAEDLPVSEVQSPALRPEAKGIPVSEVQTPALTA